jgi:hypothetical protein
MIYLAFPQGISTRKGFIIYYPVLVISAIAFTVPNKCNTVTHSAVDIITMSDFIIPYLHDCLHSTPLWGKTKKTVGHYNKNGICLATE